MNENKTNINWLVTFFRNAYKIRNSILHIEYKKTKEIDKIKQKLLKILKNSVSI